MSGQLSFDIERTSLLYKELLTVAVCETELIIIQ